MLIYILTFCIIIAWLLIAGPIEDGVTKDITYPSFRTKCNAINEFKKSGFSFQNESLDKIFEKITNPDEEEAEKIKRLKNDYKLNTWKKEDPYSECLTKELKDCSYSGSNITVMSIFMGILSFLGIVSFIFTIIPALKRFPITMIIVGVLQNIGLLTDELVFAIFIIVIVSIYWAALAERYKEDCQGVIDAKKDWYDYVPVAALTGTVGMTLYKSWLIQKRRSEMREKVIRFKGKLNEVRSKIKQLKFKKMQKEITDPIGAIKI